MKQRNNPPVRRDLFELMEMMTKGNKRRAKPAFTELVEVVKNLKVGKKASVTIENR